MKSSKHPDLEKLNEDIAQFKVDAGTLKEEIKSLQQDLNWDKGKVNPTFKVLDQIQFYQEKAQKLERQYKGYVASCDLLMTRAKTTEMSDAQRQAIMVDLRGVKQALTVQSEVDRLAKHEGSTRKFFDAVSTIQKAAEAKPQDMFQQLASSGVSQQAALSKTLAAGPPKKSPPPIPEKPKAEASMSPSAPAPRKTTILPPPPPPLVQATEKDEEQKPKGPRR